MTLAETLAVKHLRWLTDCGIGMETAIAQTAEFLQSQGYGAEYSEKTARQSAELI